MTPLRFTPYSRNMPSKLSSKDEERDKAKEGLFEASEKKSVKGVFKHVSRGGWEKKKHVSPHLSRVGVKASGTSQEMGIEQLYNL